MNARTDTPRVATQRLTITPPSAPLVGTVMPPGSKSITNRALLLAGLARGTSQLTGALTSQDTTLMSTALRQLGVDVHAPDDRRFVVTSTGVLSAPSAPLMLGNAGTATRFLTAAAALVDGTVVIDGDEHMRTRPIAPLVTALRMLGVDVQCPTGCPPVTVQGHGRLESPRVEIDGSLSSQYVSALLMIAPFGNRPIDVALLGTGIGARGYIDLTIAVMRAFGGEVDQVDDRTWRVAPARYRATTFHVEPDASAATYFWAAEVLTGGAIDLGVTPAAFTQPDAKAAALISRFPNLPPIIDGSQMQDAVPTIAVLAAFNRTPVRFTGVANLRVKECDRISALATELSRIKPGLGVEAGDDLVVASDPSLAGQTRPTAIETYADHRIAMSFALAGLKIDGITILNPDCVGKTYPGYWDALRSLGVHLEPSA